MRIFAALAIGGLFAFAVHIGPAAAVARPPIAAAAAAGFEPVYWHRHWWHHRRWRHHHWYHY